MNRFGGSQKNRFGVTGGDAREIERLIREQLIRDRLLALIRDRLLALIRERSIRRRGAGLAV